MNSDQVRALLDSVPVTTDEASDEKGWLCPPSGRSLTFYCAHGGVSLTVGKIEAVRFEEEILRARTRKGEMYHVLVSDIFAVALEAAEGTDRKTGFASR